MTAAAGHPQLAAVARGGALNLLGAGFSALASVAVLVLLTRGLGAAEAGTIFAATSIFLVLEVLGRLGADVSLVYFLPRQRAVSGRVTAGTLTTALRPVLAASTCLGLGLFLAAEPIAGWLVEGSTHPAVTYLRVLAVFLPPASLSAVVLGATRGFGDMKPTVLIERLGRSLAQLVLVLLSVAATASGTWAVFGWVAGYLPAAVVSAVSLRRLQAREQQQDASLERPQQSSAEFWRFTAPRALASVAQVVLQRLDVVLVVALLGAAEAAVYAAATRFLVVGQLGVQALSFAVQPPISAALAVGDVGRARVLYQLSTGWLILLVWPMLLTAALFAPMVLRLFGDSFSAGESVMVVLAAAMLVATGCGFVDVVLILSGRTTWSLLNTLVALAVDIALDVWLIPRIGLLGAAIGWAAAILVNNLVPLAQVKHFVGVHPLGSATRVAAALALLFFGLLPGLALLVTASRGYALATTAMTAPAYLALVWRRRELWELQRLRARGAAPAS